MANATIDDDGNIVMLGASKVVDPSKLTKQVDKIVNASRKLKINDDGTVQLADDLVLEPGAYGKQYKSGEPGRAYIFLEVLDGTVQLTYVNKDGESELINPKRFVWLYRNGMEIARPN